MRKHIVAGNWKMNLNYEEAIALCNELVKGFGEINLKNVEVILAPSYPFLDSVRNIIESHPSIQVSAQNVHRELSGAFTGEVSAKMLASMGINYSLVGHSERRNFFNENEGLLAKKIDRILETGMRPIYCLGESLDQRYKNETYEIIENQLVGGAFHLQVEEFSNVIIAYEPVWAIGTGKTATAQEAQDVHAHIRSLVTENYGEELAGNITILYGGSVKPENASELFAQPDIDGGLIGGASLKAESFIEITKALL